MTTSTAPEVSIVTRTPSNGPRPLFSTNMAKADADRLAGVAPPLHVGPQLRPVHGGQRLAEQSRIVAGIERDMGAERLDRTRIGHLGRGDQISPPDLDAVDSDLGGNRVEQAFAHERAFETSRRAIGAARRLVGQPDMADRAVGRNAIRAGQHGGGKIGNGGRVRAHVGALVVKEFVVDGEDAAFGLDGRPDAMELLARMVGGDQVLAAVLDPFHRPAEPERRGAHQNILGIELAADAEAAADMALVEMHPRRRKPEHAGDLVAIPMRHLGRAMQFQHLAGAVITSDCAAGLERHAGMAPDAELERNRRMGVAEGRIDVAVFLADHARLGRAARLEFAGRLVRPQQRRQFLELEHDPVGDILGKIRILGKHRGDRVAHIAHPAAGQDALAVAIQSRDLAQAKVDRRNVGHIRGGPDRMHARRVASGRCIDRQKPGVGVGRAHHTHVQLAEKGDIGGKPALAEQQRPILEAGDRTADNLVPGVWHVDSGSRPLRSRPRSSPHLGRSGANRLDDVLVAGASAEIRRQDIEKLIVGDVRLALQHRRREHQEPRRAEAALQAVVLHEGALQRMQRVARWPILRRCGSERDPPARQTSGRTGPDRRRR